MRAATGKISPALAAGVILFLLHTLPGGAADRDTLYYLNGQYVADYPRADVRRIIGDQEQFFTITFHGIRLSQTEKVRFQTRQDTVEGVIKAAARLLGISNYAFTYGNGELTEVYFAPSSGMIRPDADASEPDIPPPVRAVRTGVRVTAVSRGSDIAPESLQADDIIVEYDHIPITRGPLELLELMKQKTMQDAVEVRISRDNAAMTVYVPGGPLDAGLTSVPLDHQSR